MINYKEVKPELLKQVEKVIDEAGKHKYSVSAVYGAYNAAYNLKEKPQTCSSCLRARVSKLREWLKGYKEYQKKSQGISYNVTIDDAETSITILEDGKAQDKDGKNLKPGKYPVIEGGTIVVSVGSKGRFEESEQAPKLETNEPTTYQLADGRTLYVDTENNATFQDLQGVPFAVAPGEYALEDSDKFIRIDLVSSFVGIVDTVTYTVDEKDGGKMELNPTTGEVTLDGEPVPKGEYFLQGKEFGTSAVLIVGPNSIAVKQEGDVFVVENVKEDLPTNTDD